MRGRSSCSGSNRAAWMVIFFGANPLPLLRLVRTGLGLEVRDAHVSILEPGQDLVCSESDRVLQVLLVIPLREVAPRMRATRLLAGQRGRCDRLRHLEHEVELERGAQVRVEGAA